MSSLSNYAENELLDHVLGVGSYTSPTNVYLALFLNDPTDAGTGTEVNGNGYARQELTMGAASNGTSSNTAQVTFTASGGSFGTVTHVGIYDASTSGNLLFHTALTSSKTIGDGETLSFQIGAITTSLA